MNYLMIPPAKALRSGQLGLTEETRVALGRNPTASDGRLQLLGPGREPRWSARTDGASAEAATVQLCWPMELRRLALVLCLGAASLPLRCAGPPRPKRSRQLLRHPSSGARGRLLGAGGAGGDLGPPIPREFAEGGTIRLWLASVSSRRCEDWARRVRSSGSQSSRDGPRLCC